MMKKFLAFVLCAVMLSAMLAIPAFAARTNVDADALKFASKPTIDGTLSTEEWGEKTVTVKGEEAANKDDKEAPSPTNTYMEFSNEAQLKMSYDLWLRWDDEYFYIGAIVNDIDGFANTHSKDDIWNGDCLQTRIDPAGPASRMEEKIPGFNYLTDAYVFSKGNYKDNGANAWANAKNLINAGFALVNGGKTVQAYDMEAKEIMTDTLCAITTVPNDPNSEEDFGCTTTYEIAIPWKTIGEDFTPEADKILGMALVVLNGSGSGADSWLTWGTGICGGQCRDAQKTVGGPNAVTLKSDTVTPADTYDKTPESTTPDTTTKAPDSTPTTTNAPTTTKAADKVNTPNDMSNIGNDGLPGWAIALIIVGAVVVVAVVVIIIVAKKKGGAKADEANADDKKDDEAKGE